jgi:hypothetical protein
MNDFQTFVSPLYPVLFTVDEPEFPKGDPAALSLALLVRGIPSFLATIPVDLEILEGITTSLRAGDVRVTVEGFTVDPSDTEHGDTAEEGLTIDEADGLPGALLGLRCQDGRMLKVARIVSRSRSATPEGVARYVLRQITQGVQIPDLASAG